MARCPDCGTDVPAASRYCPSCGALLGKNRSSREQPALPFSPWGAPPPVMQTAGDTAAVRGPAVGPPLTTKQVIIAVGGILLFLAMFLIIGQDSSTREKIHQDTGVRTQIPSLGIKGELINVGKTGWGVAFTDTSRTFGKKTATRGQFYAVGVFVLNRGAKPIQLTTSAAALTNSSVARRYQPMLSAWGTPEELNAGRFTTRYTLGPDAGIAGILIFDIPVSFPGPRLLIRDLTTGTNYFSGTVDLTREKK